MNMKSCSGIILSGFLNNARNCGILKIQAAGSPRRPCLVLCVRISRPSQEPRHLRPSQESRHLRPSQEPRHLRPSQEPRHLRPSHSHCAGKVPRNTRTWLTVAQIPGVPNILLLQSIINPLFSGANLIHRIAILCFKWHFLNGIPMLNDLPIRIEPEKVHGYVLVIIRPNLMRV